MSYRPRIPSPGRRAVLRGSLIAPAALALSPATASAAPALHLAGRPEASWGVQVGGVTASSALLWVRSDRPARMLVETSATESFRRVRRWHGPRLGPGTDFTGTTPLYGLPAGEQVHYRVTLADPADPRRTGKPVYGTFRTAPARRRSGVRFLWSGDIAGQGWGINPDIGGYRVYEEMRRLDPDFFLCSGDSIYADGPLEPSVTLPDGRIWRNVMTEEKAKVAETLDEYRGNFRYNLLDRNVRRFNAQVPSVVQWDDHEVRNNWYPGQILDDARYTEKNVDILAARSVRAFQEYVPLAPSYGSDRRSRMYRVVHHGPLLDVFVLDMRSHRNANSPNRQADDTTGILGAEQLRWLKRSLAASRAEWKVIAADMPLGLVVPDGATNFEAVAQGDPGAPLGREPPDRRTAPVRQAPRGHRHRVADGRRPLHLGAALRAGAGGVQGLRTVLGVRVRAAGGRRLPGQRAGRHVRPGPGLRAGSRPGQRLADGVPAVFRRGGDRRRQRGADGAAAGRGRSGAVLPGAPAGSRGAVNRGRGGARCQWWVLRFFS
ncbi:hypothetical protein SGRI78S_03120 [Streptomyces griseus subsp. griseus]